jgi:DUF1680 family protein
VTLSDTFWQPRREINRTVTLPTQFRHLEDTGRLDNLRSAAGKKDIAFQGIYFNDSDVYKWLEAAASTLATNDDVGLREMANVAVQETADAQQPDGYLNSYFMCDKASERWTNLRDMHELYCAGHLIQAAVAHYRATGEDSLLSVARRLADCVAAIFGPEGEGKKNQTDGHEEIEMALVELFRATGERRYLDLARFFIDVRGHKTIGGSAYHQDHVPFRELDDVTGHAVRMMYLTAAPPTCFWKPAKRPLKAALERQWANMTERRMYVSGGLGSRYEGEAFGKDYELPNARAYTETCAAIGSVMWNHRMLAATGDARYADLLEHTLINAVLPGLSLDGQSYFYQNPLENDGTHRRQPWFGCACCPPNVARLLAQLPGYAYSTTDNGDVYVHLYAQGTANINLPDGRAVRLAQQTNYPWDGEITLTLEQGEGNFRLFLRVPAWCEEGATLEVNDEAHEAPLTPGTYVALQRDWRPGDTVRLRLPMPIRRVACHPHVAENAGRVALLRGPVLYCLEAADNPDIADQRDLILPDDAGLAAEQRPDLLGGVVVLRGEAVVATPDQGWAGRLYRTAGESETGKTIYGRVPVTFVPYYAWANRAPGQMQVWVRRTDA